MQRFAERFILAVIALAALMVLAGGRGSSCVERTYASTYCTGDEPDGDE